MTAGTLFAIGLALLLLIAVGPAPMLGAVIVALFVMAGVQWRRQRRDSSPRS